MNLSPTLWRTCRVLSGVTRLRLFRRICQKPGLPVSALAQAERISLGRASQELRRLQARGLLRVERISRWVRYYPEPDPAVPSAKAVLGALRETCAFRKTVTDERTARLALGVAHEKRLAMVRVLRSGPLAVHEMQTALRIPAPTLWHHLRFLEAGGWVIRARGRWHLASNGHPLAPCLLKLI